MSKSKNRIGILGRQSKGAAAAPKARTPKVHKQKGKQRQKQSGAQHASSPRKCKLQSVLHRQASDIIARLLSAEATGRKGGSVKGLCLAPNIQHKAAVYAVVCETLRYKTILSSLLSGSDFSAEQPQVRKHTASMLRVGVCVTTCTPAGAIYGTLSTIMHMHLQVPQSAALVLLYDLLVGQGVRPHGNLERKFLAHADSFREKAAELLAASSVSSISELLEKQGAPGPRQRARRHARVNSLRGDVHNVIALLATPPHSWPEKHREPLDAVRDEHLSDVVSLPSTRDLHDHPLVAAGTLVLQSKASSMPAHALQAQPGWHVVDCCAAPGNKTSHVAAFVGAEGKVTAFEKDSARCKTLRSTLERTGATHAAVLNQVRNRTATLCIVLLLAATAFSRWLHWNRGQEWKACYLCVLALVSPRKSK